MAPTSNDTSLISWDDLLAAINPQPESPETLYRRALGEVVQHWQSGSITDEQAENLIQALVAANITRQANAMVNDFFSPGGFVGHRCFSLI